MAGSPDPLRGQIVKAFIVPKPGVRTSSTLLTELQEHVKNITVPYKYCRAIEFVDTLPKAHSGKIRRYKLREQEARKGALERENP